FPLEEKEAVRERLARLFKEQQATALAVSASCGSDLLALQVAGELGIRRRVILPFSHERFRAISVVDRPGDWGPLFDQFIQEGEASGDLVQLDLESEDDAKFEEVFRFTNKMILEEAQQMADTSSEDTVLAVIVWEGQSRGPGDLTEDFANQARERFIPVV